MNLTIPIPGNFLKYGAGPEWVCEIETAVSDLPRTVTGFVFHAHVTYVTSASSPAASVFVGKAEKPRTIPDALATIAMPAAVVGDLQADGTFGIDHASGSPILISVCASGADPSDSIYLSDLHLELVE